MVLTGVVSSAPIILLLLVIELSILESISDAENSEYSDDAEGLDIEEMSETIPLDNAESKLLFSDEGVLAGLERQLLLFVITVLLSLPPSTCSVWGTLGLEDAWISPSLDAIFPVGLEVG